MTFGSWQFPGGTAALALALTKRLQTRGVEVLLDTAATDLVSRAGAVVGVRTPAGVIDADAVVVACDPRQLAALGPDQPMPAFGPQMTLLGLTDSAAAPTHEVVLHGRATMVVRPSATDPRAVTVLTRGRLDEDVVTALARRRWAGPEGETQVDLRDAVATRMEVSAADQVLRWRGSPLGVACSGRRNDRLGPLTEIRGVYAGGAWSSPGLDLSFAALTAAPIAGLIGPASSPA